MILLINTVLSVLLVCVFLLVRFLVASYHLLSIMGKLCQIHL